MQLQIYQPGFPLLPNVFSCAFATTVLRPKNSGLSLHWQFPIIKIHIWIVHHWIYKRHISFCPPQSLSQLRILKIRYWSKMEAKSKSHYMKVSTVSKFVNQWFPIFLIRLSVILDTLFVATIRTFVMTERVAMISLSTSSRTLYLYPEPCI